MDQNNSQIATWLIGHSGGQIKSAKQADRVLLAFAIIALIISLFLFIRSGHFLKHSSSAKTGTQIPAGMHVPQGFSS